MKLRQLLEKCGTDVGVSIYEGCKVKGTKCYRFVKCGYYPPNSLYARATLRAMYDDWDVVSFRPPVSNELIVKVV